MSYTNNLFIIFLIFLAFAILGVQVFLSTRKNVVWGIAIPAIFLIFAAYNLYSDLFIPKLHPSIAETLNMIVGSIGFGVSILILIVCRLAKKNKSL